MRNEQSSGKYGMLAIGVAGGMLLGRVLPVLFANASGVARSAAGQDSFAGLIRQHRELLALLTQMENTSAQSTIKRMGLFLKFKRLLAKHALAEEDIVYPLLQNDAERKEEAQKLYQEHADMKVLLFELNRSIKSDTKWVECVQRLRGEIEPHARREEETEFPKLRELMADASGATAELTPTELSRRIHQEESLIV